MKNNILLVKFFLAIIVVPFICSAAAAQPGSSPRTFNEVHVLRSLMQIHNAQMTYSATTGNSNFGSLQQLRQAGLIDASLATGEKYGYTFVVSTTPWIPWTPTTPGSPSNFTVTATPRLYRKSGLRSFYIDAFGEFRGGDKNGQPATVSDALYDFDLCTRGSIPDNERCFVDVLRTLHGAEMTFSSTGGNGNFGTLTQIREMNLINQSMSTGIIRGYSFTISTTPRSSGEPATFRISGVPVIYGSTGVRSFFIDTSGVVFAADRNGEPANQDDPPLEDCYLSNEICAVSSMYSLFYSQSAFAQSHGSGSYGSLNALLAARLVGPLLASGVKNGYVFTVTLIPSTKTTPASYKIAAVPQQYGSTGVRSFYVDKNGGVHGADRQGGPADQNDPVVSEY